MEAMSSQIHTLPWDNTLWPLSPSTLWLGAPGGLGVLKCTVYFGLSSHRSSNRGTTHLSACLPPKMLNLILS